MIGPVYCFGIRHTLALVSPRILIRDQNDRVAYPFDEHHLALKAKVPWQSNGLTLSVLEESRGFHTVLLSLRRRYLKLVKF